MTSMSGPTLVGLRDRFRAVVKCHCGTSTGRDYAVCRPEYALNSAFLLGSAETARFDRGREFPGTPDESPEDTAHSGRFQCFIFPQNGGRVLQNLSARDRPETRARSRLSEGRDQVPSRPRSLGPQQMPRLAPDAALSRPRTDHDLSNSRAMGRDVYKGHGSGRKYTTMVHWPTPTRTWSHLKVPGHSMTSRATREGRDCGLLERWVIRIAFLYTPS